MSSVSVSSRKTTPATVEKWKSELVKDAVAEWFVCETDSNNTAKDIKCNLCASYQKEICLMQSYSDAFVVGSKKYKKSAVKDHIKTKPHMKAYQIPKRSARNEKKI